VLFTSIIANSRSTWFSKIKYSTIFGLGLGLGTCGLGLGLETVGLVNISIRTKITKVVLRNDVSEFYE